MQASAVLGLVSVQKVSLTVAPVMDLQMTVRVRMPPPHDAEQLVQSLVICHVYSR